MEIYFLKKNLNIKNLILNNKEKIPEVFVVPKKISIYDKNPYIDNKTRF